MKTQEAIDFFATLLKNKGFKKKGKKWYLADENLSRLIELQASNYWKGYYINLGIYFFKLGKETKPDVPLYDCHLTHRVTELPIEFENLNVESISTYIDQIQDFFTQATNFKWLLENIPENLKTYKIDLMNVKKADLLLFLGKT